MNERLDITAAAGLGVRMPVTFLVMMGSKFNFLEKLFFAIAWSPKVILALRPSSKITARMPITCDRGSQACLKTLPYLNMRCELQLMVPLHPYIIIWDGKL